MRKHTVIHARLLLMLLFVGLLLTCANARGEEVPVEQVVKWVEAGDGVSGAFAVMAIENRQWTAAEARTLSQSLVANAGLRLSWTSAAAAVRSLATRHPDELKPATQALIDGLGFWRASDSVQTDLCAIARALARIGKPAASGANALLSIREAEERYPYGSVWASCALATIRGDEREPIDWLLARLDGDRRPAVIAALATIGPAAKISVPRLEVLLKDDAPAIRVLAADALWRIEGSLRPDTLELLATALEESPQDFALEPFGPSPPPLDHATYAAASLRRMRDQAKPIVPRLLQINERGTTTQKRLAESILKQLSQE